MFSTEKRRQGLLLTGIFIVGLIVRMIGIDYGLPYLYDPDEILFVGPSLNILAHKDPNPHWFGNPASTVIYSLSGIYAVSYVVGTAVGEFHNPEDFRKLYYSDPAFFYLIGRISIAVVGALTILVVYWIGKKVFGSVAAIVGAAMFAVMPLLVQLSQLIRSDVHLTLIVLFVFWFSLKILQSQTPKNYVLAGLFSGLAVSAKFTGATSGIIVLAAHLLCLPMKRPLRQHLYIGLSGLSCLIAFFITSPFVFLSYEKAYHDFIIEMRSEHLSATGTGFFSDLLWYAVVLNKNISIIGIVLLLIGLYYCYKQKEKEKILVTVYPIAFLIFLGTASLRWERWLLPALPFVALLVGYGFSQLTNILKIKYSHKVSYIVCTMLLATMMGLILYPVYVHTAAIRGGDTRTVARHWMLNNIPQNSRILVEVYTPQLPKNRFHYYRVVDGKLKQLDPKVWSFSNFRPGGHIGRLEDNRGIESIDFFVMSNIYQRYLDEKGKYSKQAKVYEDLVKSGTFLFETKPIEGQRTGPLIRVYRLH